MDSLEKEMLDSGLPVASLMEKVGQHMSAWFLGRPELLERGVLVLVGPGHNGGDGLVVARELHLAGVKVKLWCPMSISKSLTKQHFSYLSWLGVENLLSAPDASDAALWIEAIFGLAQSRPLSDSLAELFQARQLANPGRLVSLDVPAGVCSDTGKLLSEGAAVATTTLTVGLIKQGLIQDAALENVGRLVRIDIDVPPMLLNKFLNKAPLRINKKDLRSFQWPVLPPATMKYERGRVLVIAGSEKYPGAALLALKGALASGAGSIKIDAPSVLAEKIWPVLPEVVMSHVFYNYQKIGISLEASLARQDLGKVDSILIGPGIDFNGKSWSLIAEHLKCFLGLLVIDADGLNQLSNLSQGWKWLLDRSGPTWITPHLAEFRKLFPEIDPSQPLKAALEAARMSGSGVVLKGAHSVVADAYGGVWQVGETTSIVARTGLGDLLAGYVAGLGSISVASDGGCSAEVLAGATFLHAEAARRCKKGSSASSVASVLESLTTFLQSKECGQ